jgi:hypothetical protein
VFTLPRARVSWRGWDSVLELLLQKSSKSNSIDYDDNQPPNFH